MGPILNAHFPKGPLFCHVLFIFWLAGSSRASYYGFCSHIWAFVGHVSGHVLATGYQGGHVGAHITKAF
jgi:hypothetical protein